MADEWDDWGDGDNKSANGSDKSEGWDWPSAAAPAPFGKQEQHQQQSSASLEEDGARDAALEDMTEEYFVELRQYLQDLADPSVREEIDQVTYDGSATLHGELSQQRPQSEV